MLKDVVNCNRPVSWGWLPSVTGASGACVWPEDERNETRAGVNHLQKILFHVEEVPRDETRLRGFPGLWKSHRLFKHLLWITYHRRNILWFLD